jgi:hypothetical protein
MQPRRVQHRAALSVVLALGALLPASCGASFGESYCSTICDCVSCTDAESEICTRNLDDGSKEADDLGCGGELGDVFNCLKDNTQCSESNQSQIVVDVAPCEENGTKLFDCASKAKNGVCLAFTGKFVACGLGGGTVTPRFDTNGSGVVACKDLSTSAQCILGCESAASCDDLRAALQGNVPPALAKCTQGCAG